MALTENWAGAKAPTQSRQAAATASTYPSTLQESERQSSW